MTTARPNEPIVAACMSSPRPSSANRASWVSEIGRAAVELGPSVHEEADHAALEGDRIHVAQVQRGQPRGRRSLAEGGERLVAGVPIREQHGWDPRPGERDDQSCICDGPARRHRQRWRGDDRQVPVLERVERGHARFQDAHPADLALTSFGGQVLVATDHACRREERSMQVVERRHPETVRPERLRP